MKTFFTRGYLRHYLVIKKQLASLLFVFFFTHTAIAGIEPIPSGSIIVNMGVVPQTYANGLKPWGMVYALIHNYKVPVKWVINQSKVKDGADFTYNGTDFKGGSFIILQKNRSAKVDSTINAWQLQGVVIVTTNSAFNVDVTYTIKYNPLWTFDFQNGKIAINYLTLAGIPSISYPVKYPEALNDCDDLFVMPHADPTWPTHSNLKKWNATSRGWLWYGCHAGSVAEGLVNPYDSTDQMNFLTTNGLINFSDHSNPTTPYSYRFNTDPEMQFMGTIDAAVTNGSEQVYLPNLNGGWRSSTHIGVWDPTDPDVPTLSKGEGAIIAYGRAFGDTANGKVMMQAGHSFDKGNSAAVSAIRAFFNFSYLSVLDKIVEPIILGPLLINAGSPSSYIATMPAGYNIANYSFHWSSNGPGVFSNEFGAATTFTPAAVSIPTNYTLMVTNTDGCGREYYQTIDIVVSPVPPVALDRTTQSIINPPGTGPQPIANITPLAGTDADGYVSNYILTSLPANGILFYDNDNNAGTADVSITSLPNGGLVLTKQQMKSIKFDPVDGFGGNTNFQYIVQDNTNLFSLNTATYTIPVNPPPVAQSFICTPVTSNAAETSVCPLVATDNNSVVSYTIVSLPSTTKCQVYLYKALVTAGQVISPAQASLLTYKPSGTYIGYAEITYTATDNDGAPCQKIATITLQMVNQPPVAQNISAPVITNPVGTIQIAIPALSAADIDGSIASYKITNIPSPNAGILYYNNAGTYTAIANNQVLTIAQAGTLKFDPVDTYTGIAQFKYTATDDGGLTGNTPATYSIPVKTTPPNANNITNTSIYCGAGLTTIKPMVAHDNDTTDIITAYIIKNLPSSSMGVVYYNNSGSYVPCVTGLEMTPAQGTTLKFNPTPGFTGNALFTYTAKDDEGLTDPTAATFTIPVTNQPPSATNVNNTAISDTSAIKTLKPLTGTDADGSIVSFVILTLPNTSTGILSLGGVPVTAGQVISTGQANALQFTPVLHNSTDATFRFTAIDNFGLADASAATCTIPINLVSYKIPPTADTKTNPAINLKTISNNLLPLSGNDADGVITSYQITKLNKPNEGTLYLQGLPVVNNQVINAKAAGQLTFIPSGTFQGTSNFNYVSIDNDSNLSVEATFNIPLINAIPVANDFIASQVKTNTTASIPGLQASDSDGTVLSYKILTLPYPDTLKYDFAGNGTTYKNVTLGMVLNYTKVSRLKIVTANTPGITSFTFVGIDNLNDTSNTATYTIPIGSATLNQKPFPKDVTSLPIAYNAGLTAISSLLGTDVDGIIKTYVIEKIPSSVLGYLYYDSSGYYALYRGIMNINPLQSTTLKFDPSGIYSGDVTFTYKVIDSSGAYSQNTATFTIPITNTPPVILNITNSSIPSNNGPTFLTPLNANTNGIILNYVITNLPNPSQGTLVMDGSAVQLNQVIPALYAGRLEFDPNSNFSGNAAFSFTAVDNFGTIDITPATFTIPVTNQAPVADNKLSQVITNQLSTPAQNIPTLTGIDNDGTITSYIIKTLPANGKLYNNGTLVSSLPVGGLSITPAQAAQLSFDPDDNFGGTATFTYTVKDNSNNISATAATYQILVNVPPVTNNVTATAMSANQTRTGIPALTGTDDVAVSFYSIVTLPSATDGILYLNNVAVTDLAQVDTLTTAQVSQLSFQPSSTFAGSIFSYTATDNTGLIDVTPAVYTLPFIATFSALPLNLLSFSGHLSGKDNLLNWVTAQEINTNYFEIETQTETTGFAKIGKVLAKGSSVQNSYSFVDQNPLEKINYYRLKQVDKDGGFKYSNIIVLKRDVTGVGINSIYPNPFEDKIEVSITVDKAKIITISIFDMNGKLMKKDEAQVVKGLNNIIISGLENISSGVYLMEVKDDANIIKSKLIKSN